MAVFYQREKKGGRPNVLCGILKTRLPNVGAGTRRRITREAEIFVAPDGGTSHTQVNGPLLAGLLGPARITLTLLVGNVPRVTR